MSTLTAKMATNRVSSSSICGAFFPFNEGSGTTFTDVVSGAIITDASATHTGNPHAPAIGIAANTSVGTGNFTEVNATENLVFIYGTQVVTAGAFINSIFGTTTGSRIGIASGTTPTAEDDDGTAVTFTTPTAALDGQDAFYMLVLDRDGNAYTYESINGAAASLKGSAVAHSVDGKITIPKTMQLGNTSVRQEQYGAALCKFADSKTDTEYKAALDFIVKSWSVGRKVLPEGFY